ncbi:hypothetical protein PG996_010408 [Apiospora saccharicola]|uniref:Uncharacterized protein n=1 Tax=Apiospora saccharicola TaxID=335842 RepID=A0ABR1UNH2_9PEZI
MDQEKKGETGGEEAYLLDGLDSTLDGLRLRGGESEDDLLVKKVGDVLDPDQAEDLELLERLELQQQAVLQVGVVEGGARALEDLGAVNVRGNLSVLDLLSQLVEGFLGSGLGVSLSLGIGRGLVCSSAWGGGLVRIGGLISRCAEGLVIDGSRESRVDRESQGGEDGGVDELHFDGSGYDTGWQLTIQHPIPAYRPQDLDYRASDPPWFIRNAFWSGSESSGNDALR